MACFLMGVFANLPLAVAPGMGINGESATAPKQLCDRI
jgi:xanthine/uracil/vitamin C permease (AzgA family)